MFWDTLAEIAATRGVSIDRLIAETGKSVVLCTHLLGDVERLCDQVVILHEGAVLHCGSMSDLKASMQGRYELGWQGSDVAFRRALGEAGAEVSDGRQPGSAVVTVPPSWGTLALFEIARTADVVLTRLRPQEEDLARMFMRLTVTGKETARPGERDGSDGS
ncbi:MAG: hypothetical protein IIA36_06090 [Proteobacteria bacterium]|nr:hypothetical protein [Pseudomonadota bacterium]